MKPNRFTVLSAIAKVERLGASAAVLSKALRLLRDPRSTATSLVEVIQADPAMTADLISLGNSAYYGVTSRISTLTDAVNLLGYDEVYRMIGFNSSKQIFAQPLAAYGLTAEEDWSLSVGCALLMQELAPLLGIATDESYTTGLLHRVGRRAIDFALQEVRLVGSFQTSPLPLVERENAFVGMSFSDVGGMLLERWRFPDHVVDAVRLQHCTIRPADSALLTALRLAVATLGGAAFASTSERDAARESLNATLSKLGQTWANLEAMRQASETKLATLRRSLGFRT
ncbi:MAG: HDOD domain-containing protein [Verrucomicrobiales bacterium]|nr:HDOD domain-containing protein [Verrucomicrobiales bacterium]